MIIKKALFINFVCLLIITFSQAQNSSGFGIKAGINYNANGDYFESINSKAQHPDRNAGFHLGVFAKFGDNIFIKPELVYTRTKSDYGNNTFKMQKLDAPVLVGVKLLNVFNVFAGPSFQYILDSKFGDVKIKDIKNDFTVGLNFGVGLSFNKIGIDLRYERGFNNNEASFINNNISPATESKIDTRPDQLILSVSLML